MINGNRKGTMPREYAPKRYYETFQLDKVRDPQTILAYEMNRQTVPTPHGATCRSESSTSMAIRWMVKYLYGSNWSKTSATSGKITVAITKTLSTTINWRL